MVKKVSVVDRVRAVDIIKEKKLTEKRLRFHWSYYSELARQRNEIQGSLKQAAIKACISGYQFTNYQRAVSYKHSLHPLSTAGSLSFSISGQLDKVFDLTNIENLLPIVELTKNFTISKNLTRSARLLGIQRLGVIKTSAVLLEHLLDKNWRYLPTNFDVPSNSQIFGHLVYSSGIEGILYPSKLTGKTCLAVFPNNFAESDSFLVMDDEPPHEIVVRRIDSSNRRICDLSARELFEEARGAVVH